MALTWKSNPLARNSTAFFAVYLTLVGAVSLGLLILHVWRLDRPLATRPSANGLSSPVQPFREPVQPWKWGQLPVPITGRRHKENAAFVMLVRNREVEEAVHTLSQVESIFNAKYQEPYSYVFLNDEPFDEDFIQRTNNSVAGETLYGLVPKEHWQEPPWIDQKKAAQCRKSAKDAGMYYGGSESYRRMCRYQSGFFFRHELLAEYDYYWRLEPGVSFFCDLEYDPFTVLREGNKSYGFNMAIQEYEETIPSTLISWSLIPGCVLKLQEKALWQQVQLFMEEYPKHIPSNNALQFVSEDDGESYNMCHFWSNFEIGSLNFFRSQAYLDFFHHLDLAGGFSYERWGDAPVHSIAASLLLPKEQIHYFRDIGYRHPPRQFCPAPENSNRCMCERKKSYEVDRSSRSTAKCINLCELPPLKLISSD